MHELLLKGIFLLSAAALLVIGAIYLLTLVTIIALEFRARRPCENEQE